MWRDFTVSRGLSRGLEASHGKSSEPKGRVKKGREKTRWKRMPPFARLVLLSLLPAAVHAAWAPPPNPIAPDPLPLSTYRYVGCFRDAPDRDIVGLDLAFTRPTVAACLAEYEDGQCVACIAAY